MSIPTVDPAQSIPAFYSGRSIFITGATGFMGKVLIEKLLRSCPDIQEIFLLMRPKKGLSIDDRLRKLIALPFFEKLRKERPNFIDKLIPVTGDVATEALGLPPLERKVITERVSIVFHVAANVRFDDNLKHATFVNTRSTRDICILAAQMKKLVALVHVSTAYSQADKPQVEEKVYPFNVDWKKSIRIAENVDNHLLRTLTPKYMDSFPNTYTFTKRLAEQVVHDYSGILPAIIFRPSIVISTIVEPVKGWIDNFNGPVGMLVGGGKGVLRVICLDPKITSDYIPVDVAIKAMIIASWKRGLQTITRDPSIHVYNCCSGDIKSVSTREVIDTGIQITDEIPLGGILWFPGVTITTNKTIFFILMLFYHLIPAYLVDGILKLAGKKPMLVKLQRKVYTANSSLEYFLMNVWKFKNDNFLGLLTNLPPGDAEAFGYEYFSFDIREYFRWCIVGAKKYLLHESMDKLNEDKIQYERMRWIDRIFKVWLAIGFSWLFVKMGLIAYLCRVLQEKFEIFNA
ncbi:putative fatty acyl-CoA reductase CG5065 [Belonocnema kinseyi]|uniref:putative fatty acyl-CoA reductase CG5065 n=1 Tax=Belonocnema kinseyi TaxID=2817044 RepID=UPI00143D22AB|nr:putative fatty acyl-CoA reductase CG5065 [Belonocnema kinseyi]